MPSIGDVVTVRRTWCDHNGPSMTLMEHDNSFLANRFGGEPGFRQKWFRPLAEPKTDISIFRKALTGDLVTEEA